MIGTGLTSNSRRMTFSGGTAILKSELVGDGFCLGHLSE